MSGPIMTRSSFAKSRLGYTGRKKSSKPKKSPGLYGWKKYVEPKKRRKKKNG